MPTVKTDQVLADLYKRHSRRTLIALWDELRKLSRTEFETLLSSIATVEKPRRKRRSDRTQSSLPKDTPSDRIRHLLVTQDKLNEKDAADQITRELIRQGISASRVPSDPYVHHGPPFVCVRKWTLLGARRFKWPALRRR